MTQEILNAPRGDPERVAELLSLCAPALAGRLQQMAEDLQLTYAKNSLKAWRADQRVAARTGCIGFGGRQVQKQNEVGLFIRNFTSETTLDALSGLPPSNGVAAASRTFGARAAYGF